MVKKLEPKETKGRVKLLKAIPYRGKMVYIRQFDEDLFAYDLVLKGEIWSSYITIEIPKGRKKLTKNEVNQAAALAFTGAVITIDMQLDKGKKDQELEDFKEIGGKVLKRKEKDA